MNKSIFILYGCLLLTVYLLRQTDFSSNKLVTDYLKSYSSLRGEEIQATNSTKSARLLQSSQTLDPIRVKICKDASGNVVTSSSISKFNTAKDEYRGAFGPSIGDDLFKGNVPEGSKLVQKGIIIGILIIFLIFTPLLTWCYCCYCCCDRKCPCCCRTDVEKEPFTKRQMLITLIAVFLFSALTFSASIAGYVYSSDINQSYKDVKCTIVASLDDLNYQQTSVLPDGTNAVYLGLNNLKSELSSISSSLSNYFTQVRGFSTYSNTQSTALQNQSDKITSMFNALNTIPGAFTASYVASPTIPAANGWNDKMSSNESPIFYGSGYATLVNKMTSAQNTATSNAVSAMKSAASQATSFAATNESSITSPINDAQTQVTDGQKQISDNIKKVDDNTSMSDTVFNIVTIVLMVFYGIFIFISVVGSIVSFLGYLKGMLKVRYFLNFFWCLLGILTFLGFIICVILGILSIVFMESCDTTQKLLNDKAYMKSLDVIPSEISDYLTTCKADLGGDGNILKKFNIDSQVNTITNTQQSLQNSYDSFNLATYQQFELYMTYFKKLHTTMKTNGMYFDRQDQNWSTTAPDQIGTYTMLLDYQSAVTNFKIQTDALSNQSTGTNPYSAVITSAKNDQFVFENTQCSTYSRGASVTTANYGTAISGLNCISYETLGADIHANPTKTDTRYAPVTSGTVNANFYTRIYNYVTSLNTRYNVPETFTYTGGAPFTGTRDLFIAEIQNQQSSTSAGGFGKLLSDFKDKVNTDVLQGSKTISDSLLGSNGLLNKVNCLFFGETIDNFNNQLCSNSGLAVYNTFKIMCVICFSNFVLIIYLYKMSMKFLGKKKEFEIQATKNPNQIAPAYELEKLQS